MRKHKKEKTNLQIRVEMFRKMSEAVLKLRDGKLYILKRRSTQVIEKVIMPTGMCNKYVYYTEYASQDVFGFGEGDLRRGWKITINQLQFYEVIRWTRKMAPLLINIGWMSDDYKNKAFN